MYCIFQHDLYLKIFHWLMIGGILVQVLDNIFRFLPRNVLNLLPINLVYIY
jgi:hypothetical protein